MTNRQVKGGYIKACSCGLIVTRSKRVHPQKALAFRCRLVSRTAPLRASEASFRSLSELARNEAASLGTIRKLSKWHIAYKRKKGARYPVQLSTNSTLAPTLQIFEDTIGVIAWP